MNRLQRLIQEYLDTHPDEKLTDLARESGIPTSTMYDIARTEKRRQTPHPDTIRRLAQGLKLPYDQVKAAAGDAAGYGSDGDELDQLIVELAESAKPLDDERKRELIRRARFYVREMREEESRRQGRSERGE